MLNKVNFLGDFTEKIFFCGIGGASMLGLSQLALSIGYTVLGSDCAASDELKKLCKSKGIELFDTHRAENVEGCDVFVYSAAIHKSNPELQRATELGIRILTRAEFLGMISDMHETSIAIAGTHGKSTTTHMLYEIFRQDNRTPTFLCGAPSRKNGSYACTEDSTLIYEACEYNRSFLNFRPTVAVILNIEKEHTDTYPEIKDSELAFYQFAKNSASCILNGDSQSCRRVGDQLTKLGKRVLYFSMHDTTSDAFLKELSFEYGKACFKIIIQNRELPSCSMRIYGKHNVYNALAAALTADFCGISADSISGGLCNFVGIERRFEYIGNINGADVFDDYAHHPSEIRATLTMAKSLGYTKIICAFQPHTYSRTHSFFNEFTQAFEYCDHVVFADIFPAREVNIYGVSSELLAKNTKNGIYMPSFEAIKEYLEENAESGVLIITMGAGLMNKIAYDLTKKHF